MSKSAYYVTSNDDQTLMEIFTSIEGHKIEAVGHYLGSPMLVLEDGRKVVFSFDEGYYYSEYTQEDPSFTITLIERNDDDPQ